MKITIVFDHTPHHHTMEIRFGFACVIETGLNKILFDTGSDGSVLLSNMEKVNQKLQDIDMVVLSHNHWDHVGGLNDFLRENDNVYLYLPFSFPVDFKSQLRKTKAKVIEVRESRKLCEGAFTTGELPGVIPEQSLICETKHGSVVITGCAHPGIVNIIKQAKNLRGPVHMAVGGFHLYNEDPKSLQGIAEELKNAGVLKVCPCHCTGDNARELFHKVYGEYCYMGGAGSVFIFQ